MPLSSNSRLISKYRLRNKDKLHRSEVLKILAAAMDQGAAAAASGSSSEKLDLHNEFFNTGRSGRRNAMPDILGHHCTTSTADLPDQLSALTTNDAQTSLTGDQLPSSSVNSIDASQNQSVMMASTSASTSSASLLASSQTLSSSSTASSSANCR